MIMLMEPIPATAARSSAPAARLDDIDLFEVNEAFAPVPLAWLHDIGADPARLNVNGGAIALGHPLGATGAKLMATLVHELRARSGALRAANHVRRRRHRQRDDHRGAALSDYDVLIVGSGHGGVQTASALRQLEFAGLIAILTADTDRALRTAAAVQGLSGR